MNLSDFPRPPADNGRGIHWSPSVANVADEWLSELKALGMKWVKFMSIGGGNLAAMLLANGIMPVVRLGGAKSWPGAIDDPRYSGSYVEELKKYVALGVRYFEVGNEPNLPTEWVPGVLPAQGLVETVMSDWVKSVQIVLNAGGLPAFPALAPGGVYDDMKFFREACQWLADHGHQSLMRQGVWIAIHNYSLHRPWDYPEDDVNQNGTPVTPWEYGHHHWWDDHRWEQVNELRATHTNAGQTIMDDSNGFRKFEQYHRTWVDRLGFEVPILSTESGYTIVQPSEGFGDHRYPKIDFDLHARGTVRQYEYMLREAPPYYFCTADWIIANARLGNPDPQWESQSWYTGFYNQVGVRGHIPTVDAVKTMRNEPRVVGSVEASVMKGVVVNAASIKVTLRGGAVPQVQTADEGGRFEFLRLPAGTYSLDVDTLGTVAQGLQADGHSLIRVPPIAGIDLPLWIGMVVDNTSGPAVIGGMSSVIVVRILALDRVDATLSAGDWHVTVTSAPKLPIGLNVCEFAPLRGGTYRLTVPSMKEVNLDVFVDGQGTATVLVQPTGPAEVPQHGHVRGHILGAAGRLLVLLSDSLRREITLPADGSFDFGDLPAGTYRLELADKGVVAQDLRTDGSTTVEVPTITVSADAWVAEVVQNTSSNHPVGLRSSAILCEVEGKDQLDVVLSTGSWQTVARTGTKGPFKCEFAPLAAGWYNVAPANLSVNLNVWVDGQGVASVRFRAGQPAPQPPTPPGPAPQPPKTMPVYLLLGRPPADARLFTALVAYFKRFDPPWGFDVEEATHATRVFILGGEDEVSAQQAQRLTDAGCRVRRLGGAVAALAELLEQRVRQGQPLDDSA